MQIEFDNGEVRLIFGDYALMQRKVGKDMTKSIKKRVDSLIAANNFTIFLQTGLGKPHSLEGNHKGMYGVNITANDRLIIMPITDNLSAESLKKCESIIIKGVEDYHGSKNEWLIP